MPSSRVLRGVLCNFLGTYTSRYSDYNGYWLFGFLATRLEGAVLDLLAHVGKPRDLLESAHALAVREFADQLAKSGLDSSKVAHACLRIEQLAADRRSERSGWNDRFLVTATANTGRRFECEVITFIAPHDRRLELRSTRGGVFRSRRVRGALDA
jgi:hypothetical protein